MIGLLSHSCFLEHHCLLPASEARSALNRKSGLWVQQLSSPSPGSTGILCWEHQKWPAHVGQRGPAERSHTVGPPCLAHFRCPAGPH